jgi:hypothetical protein
MMTAIMVSMGCSFMGQGLCNRSMHRSFLRTCVALTALAVLCDSKSVVPHWHCQVDKSSFAVKLDFYKKSTFCTSRDLL